MLFNSYTFVIFFACVLFLHYLPFSWRVKKFQLLVASYLFYAAWNPPFVILLWISTIVDWYAARGMARSDRKGWRRFYLSISLVANLGLLGIFKYGNFLLENFAVLLRVLGVEYQPVAPDIVLPVGISFYTFQTLSYSIDVYRGNMKPWKSFLDFALFVTFFPQLVAGPIVRAVDFLPQCQEPRRATRAQFGWGISLLVLGLFQKIVVADGLLAPIADAVYGSRQAHDFLGAWVGTLAFAGQIYYDFAGYSTCAIGVAMCLGFSIPDNFRAPYAAIGFSDFWRRWHISLSSWLRDYLYISLGGSRRGHLRTYVNLTLTMLIGGLWHGASWTFVFWGGMHGVFLMVERFCQQHFSRSAFSRGRAFKLLLGGLTFVLVCFTWVFFRATSFEQAFDISAAMLGLSQAAGPTRVVPLQLIELSIVTTAMLASHWMLRDTTLEADVARFPWWFRSIVIALMIIAIATSSGEDRAFIYFQF